MLDLIEAIYAIPIIAYYDEARSQTLELSSFINDFISCLWILRKICLN